MPPAIKRTMLFFLGHLEAIKVSPLNLSFPWKNCQIPPPIFFFFFWLENCRWLFQASLPHYREMTHISLHLQPSQETSCFLTERPGDQIAALV